jgi:hypothetical protein
MEETEMNNDRSSLGDDDFVGSSEPSPLGGGGTTNIGGGTSGASLGNADTSRSSTAPINDITDTDSVGETTMPSGISDRDDTGSTRRS